MLNIVPHRKVIGSMTKLLNRFIDGRSGMIIPAATPRSEKVMQDRSMHPIRPAVMCMSPLRQHPSASMMLPHNADFTMPRTDFPSTSEVLVMGQRSISSKLS